MLSILITIYNYNLYPLVKQLNQQCLDLGIDYEILTQDDASKSPLNEENRKINELPNCYFFELEKNVGLRENKNILVEKSKFDLVLILDGDCKIYDNNFIKKYLSAIKDFDVVYGGRVHPKIYTSKNKMLRWKYGKFMEDSTVAKRTKNPYISILFNNTLIRKETFNQVKFDKSLKTYGHDDTLFSFELKKNKAKILHIENPVEHDDIDENKIFFLKTKGSIENLIYLYKNKKIDTNHINFLKIFNLLEKTKFCIILKYLYKIFEKPIEKNLTGNNPYLFVFNFFRLGYMCDKF